jgi:hypothetical protein
MATLTMAGGKPKVERVSEPAEHEQAVTEAERVLSEHIHNSVGSGGTVPSGDAPKPSK